MTDLDMAQEAKLCLEKIRRGEIDPRPASVILTGNYDQDFITHLLEFASREPAS